MDSLLRALAWWRNAVSSTSDHSALYRHAAAADAARVLTEVHNSTGEALQMWMDLGNSTTVADVAEGMQRLTQPLVRPVPRPAGERASAPRRPSMILCVTLSDLEVQACAQFRISFAFHVICITPGVRAGDGQAARHIPFFPCFFALGTGQKHVASQAFVSSHRLMTSHVCACSSRASPLRDRRSSS
jgi:hypothetical protein